MIKEYNLNKEMIFVSDFEFGKTTIVAKAGRTKYYLDLDKNSSSTFIELYPYFKDRESKSKYGFGKELRSLNIKNKTIIDKKFIEDFVRVSDCLETVMRSAIWSSMER